MSDKLLLLFGCIFFALLRERDTCALGFARVIFQQFTVCLFWAEFECFVVGVFVL